jgi:aminoglycoside phosphotransferase (APT) family kinase protein
MSTTTVTRQTIAEDLLARVRLEAGCADAEFAEAPAGLEGGYDTAIFAFRLSGAAPPWDGPLVLRLFRSEHQAQPRIESATQNAVADMGYSCPRVLLSGGDSGVVGGRPYMIMERAAGKPMIRYITSPGHMTLRASPTLAQAHARLHALDAQAFRERLAAVGLTDADLARMTFEGEFAMIEEEQARLGIAALEPAMAWLRAHRPAPRADVICHGDFHPLNVMMDADGAYSVIDWSLARFAEPEYDIARTIILWRRAPIDRTVVAGPLRLLIGAGRRTFLWRYMRVYRKLGPIDGERLRYYEGFAAMRTIITTLDGTNVTFWRNEQVLGGLAAHVRGCTGVDVDARELLSA